jgi:tetratricopeptide (TPR) repeat protein
MQTHSAVNVVIVCTVLAGAACRTKEAPDTSVRAGAMDPCVMALAPHQGTGDIDPGIARLQQAARDSMQPVIALTQLGQHFIARARTSNAAINYMMAEQAALCADAKQPGNAQALLLRGHVLHQFHRFREAEALARRAVAARGLVLDYGLLGDALLEQGKVGEASAAYQTMIDLKPYFHSYTRAAHLRWLKGDLSGAVELIRMAVNAASSREPESAAWAYSRLAAYELQAGRTEAALNAADAALGYRPEYAPALLVRGRTLLSDERVDDGIADLRRAALLSPLPEHEWALADGLRAAGDSEGAQEVEERLGRTGAAADPRTFALYLATRGERVDEAVRLAQQELDNRGDVFTFDAVAWALAAAGRTAEADDAMRRALAEGTKDARLFYHAGAIAAARGAHAEARRWFRQALAARHMLLPSERHDVQQRLAALPRLAPNRRNTL